MHTKLKALWRSKRGRRWREYLTAYLMLAPSVTLIFLFGIFPVFFALYVSLHRWRIRMGKFVGLRHYIHAIESLTFVLFFAAAAGLFFVAWRAFKGLREAARERGETPWPWALPGAVLGAASLLWWRYGVVLLPHVLKIADKAVGTRREQRMFRQWLWEALTTPEVLAALKLALVVSVAGLALWWLALRRWPTLQHSAYVGQWSVATFFLGAGALTAFFTYQQLQAAIRKAVEEGEPPSIAIHFALITLGLVLFYVAWRLWQSAVHSASERGFVFKGRAALVLLTAGWILVAELPPVIEAGDPNLWRGLVVTVYYALGTVPFQLAIALVLAYLLFQQIRGKEFFRVLYFLPYITPTVASAAVFRLLFIGHPAGLVNRTLHFFGLPPLKWLWEPRGVFLLLGNALGVSIPDWAAGPSLALVVVIIYSIWTYVGYDTVIYLAGLGNIPHEINEAAEIDGASQWQIFRHITLPLLSPTTYFLSLIAIIGTFKAFNHIYVMREPEALNTVNTFSVVIFDKFFTDTRYGYASAMAFVLFAIILSLTYINNKVQGSRVFYQ